MLAKKTVKNQITLPKKIVEQFSEAVYFDVRIEGDEIVLRPVNLHRAERVREKLAKLGITEQDVEDAVGWARGGGG